MCYKSGLLIGVCVTVVVMALVMVQTKSVKAGPPNACSLQGTWIGELEVLAPGARFLSSYHGQTPLSGTLDLQFFGVDAAIPGFFEDATDVGHAKGVWQRTGRRTYAYTMFNYGVDDEGTIVYAVKTYGTKELTEDCNSAAVDSCADYFFPDGTFAFPFCGTSTETRLELQQ